MCVAMGEGRGGAGERIQLRIFLFGGQAQVAVAGNLVPVDSARDAGSCSTPPATSRLSGDLVSASHRFSALRHCIASTVDDVSDSAPRAGIHAHQCGATGRNLSIEDLFWI